MAPSRRQQAVDAVRRRIETGEWLPGVRIPTESELTRILGVSRCTVRGALDELARAGEIERRANVGCFVASGPGGDSFRSGLIAYLESNTSGNLSGNLQLRGAELQAFEYGIDLIYCNLNGHMEKAAEFIERLCRRGCRNVLFAPEICRNYHEVNNPVLDAFEAAGLNWVVIGSPLVRDGMIRGDFVGSDNYGVMRNVVRQLVQAGHRRIGSIRVFDGVFSSDQRLARNPRANCGWTGARRNRNTPDHPGRAAGGTGARTAPAADETARTADRDHLHPRRDRRECDRRTAQTREAGAARCVGVRLRRLLHGPDPPAFLGAAAIHRSRQARGPAAV